MAKNLLAVAAWTAMLAATTTTEEEMSCMVDVLVGA